MAYEEAAAILLVGLPWYLWVWSTTMTPTGRDDWRWLPFWGLRLLSLILITLLLTIAQKWASDNGATTGLQGLFNVLMVIFIPLTVGVVGLFLVVALIRGVEWMVGVVRRAPYKKRR